MNRNRSHHRRWWLVFAPLVGMLLSPGVGALSIQLTDSASGAVRNCPVVGSIQLSPGVPTMAVTVGSGCFDGSSAPAPTEPTPTEPAPTQPAPTVPPPSDGSDPGTGLWKAGANTFVFDRRPDGGDTHVPGCIPTATTGCSRSGTINAGEVWAMRMPFKGTTSAELLTIDVGRSETGETYTSYQGAISLTPGDFNVAPECIGVSLVLRDVDAGPLPFRRPPAACALSRGQTYYLNVRPTPGSTGATRCGVSGETCRFRILNKMEYALQ